LAAERLIARPYCEQHGDLQRTLELSGINPGSWHRAPCDADLLLLIAAGLGAAIMPRSGRLGTSLHGLAIEGLGLKRPVSIYAVADRPRSAAASAVVSILRAADWRASAVSPCRLGTATTSRDFH
jgi:hypothetical protein